MTVTMPVDRYKNPVVHAAYELAVLLACLVAYVVLRVALAVLWPVIVVRRWRGERAHRIRTGAPSV